MSETNFNLEDRTFRFAQAVRAYCKNVTHHTINVQDIKQVVRSSGSVAANYIEANEALSKADFIYRIKVCRKEAKETVLWINLIGIEDKPELAVTKLQLADEAKQLMLIFNAIIKKTNAN
ncbi:four helix bundle protein [Pedobacter changchengzhani]|uniref:Four helix bundle protein n=1 Tax=Pedobacter changchengzhani TaxID=2529274 RepID=A0A4R5MPM4_9SPHI|nr:four helix bundle protein [Pedobacter changchengzhani]TDG37772.1 four helix bundle protein [Pedobacter changchengzhani]